MRRVLARWAPHTPRKPRFRPTKQRVPYQPAVVEQAGLGAGSTSVGAAGIEAGLAEELESGYMWRCLNRHQEDEKLVVLFFDLPRKRDEKGINGGHLSGIVGQVSD